MRKLFRNGGSTTFGFRSHSAQRRLLDNFGLHPDSKCPESSRWTYGRRCGRWFVWIGRYVNSHSLSQGHTISQPFPGSDVSSLPSVVQGGRPHSNRRDGGATKP